MFHFLNNLSIRVRMSISVLLFIATLLFSLYGAYNSLGANVEFAEKEKLGNYYQRPLAEVLYDASILRVLLIQQQSGADKTSAIQGELGAIAKGMEALKTVQDVAGADLQFTDEGLSSRGRDALKYEKVKAKWDTLASAIGTDPSKDHDADIASFVADIRGMIGHSGDTSNLILDPDLDSYYLMDVTLLALPQTIDRLSVIGSSFYKKIGSATKLAESDGVEVAVAARMLSEADLGRVSADFDTSFKEDKNFYGVSPTYEKTIRPLFEDYAKKNQAMVDLLSKISKGDAMASRADFLAAWGSALDSSKDLLTSSYDELDKLLAARISDYKQQQLHSILVSLAGIFVSMVFYQLVVQTLITPLGALTKTMSALSHDNLDVDVPYRDARSEIGYIAESVEVFKKNAIENKRNQKEKIEAEERAKQARKDEMQKLAQSFEARVQGIISSIASASSDLAHTATEMSRSISQSNESSHGAVDNAVETSRNVDQVATAAGELSSAVHEISRQTQNTNMMISESVEKVSGADVFASKLREASERVKNVVQLIATISGQIKMLALNATIESARAGDAGKGFAVVANEVRTLAGETDQSIQEIETVILEMNSAAEGVISALSGIKEGVDAIYAASTGIAAAVEEQSAIVNEVSRSMAVATEKTQAVRENIETVCHMTGAAEKDAQKVQVAASDLSSQGEMLEMEVASFLSEIRE